MDEVETGRDSALWPWETTSEGRLELTDILGDLCGVSSMTEKRRRARG